ncbi:MAG: di-trans,poly-cis-decaprenylcistransferase [Ruminococcaceae bacterium]|nr:di-trans,poly-cis-decaprenylcistransferase [Oscillospiraceae bacterium]
MEKKFEVLPEHIAIIMDGNGRWAKNRGLKRTEGHKVGAKVFEEICEYCAEIGVKYVTFYAFSTENWKRSKLEVTAIMNLFRGYLDRMQERVLENEQAGYRIRFLGAREGMPKDIVSRMDDVERRSADKTRININIAVNYGSRDEIVHGVRDIVREIQNGKISADDITEELISSHLYTAGQPDPDLIIRPSGEYRLSNYLMWQAAYSEIYIDDVLWPDYTPADLDRAIAEYAKRNRRFGGV